jgi:HK97 family phage major capsid protein
MSLELVEKYSKMMTFEGKKMPREDRINVTEALTTADANVLIPKVISQVVVEAAEPLYLASQFFQRVNLEGPGRSMEFIHFGAIRAFEIAETGEYPNQQLNLAGQTLSPTVDVKVKKYGLKVQISDEMISDSQWDVIGLHLRAAGRAMARKKEEVIFDEFNKHGHVVFDAKNFAPITNGDGSVSVPDGCPTGRGFDGNYNGTLTAEDMVDMAVSIMSAGFTPTDILMHPLCWSLFAKNAMLELPGTNIAAFGQGQYMRDPKSFNTNNSLGLNVIFSPYVPFNQVDKTFDFYILDRNNIGVLLVKDEISTEQFDDPLRDIQTLKIKERYGVGILYGGLGIAVARNIKYAKTWPAPAREFERVPFPKDWTGQGAKDKDNI